LTIGNVLDLGKNTGFAFSEFKHDGIKIISPTVVKDEGSPCYKFIVLEPAIIPDSKVTWACKME
jgi:hypothetical protein